MSAIDANINTAGKQDFVFVSAFTNVAGQAVISFNGTDSIARFDTNGDGASDMSIVVQGVQLIASDFILTGSSPAMVGKDSLLLEQAEDPARGFAGESIDPEQLDQVETGGAAITTTGGSGGGDYARSES